MTENICRQVVQNGQSERDRKERCQAFLNLVAQVGYWCTPTLALRETQPTLKLAVQVKDNRLERKAFEKDAKPTLKATLDACAKTGNFKEVEPQWYAYDPPPLRSACITAELYC